MRLSVAAAAAAALFLGQGLAIDIQVSAEFNGRLLDASEIKITHHAPALKPFRHHPHHNETSQGPARSNDRRRNGQQIDKRNNVVYTGNWCGLSQRAIGSDANPVQNVTGYFQIPTITNRAGQGAGQIIYSWIGIDGNSVGGSLLQAGVNTSLDASGTQKATAFLQWYPATQVTIDNLPAQAGDFYYVSINMTDNKNALVYIKDTYQGTYGLNITVSNGPALLRRDASWILEDASDASGNPLPFPHFSTSWFEGINTQLVSGTKFDASTADIMVLDSPTTGSNPPWCDTKVYDATNFYVWDSNP